MGIVSETEMISSHQMDQALVSLPSLSRWLLRSRPGGSLPEAPPPLSHVRMLILLYQRGPSTIGVLARRLGIACSTATEAVASLEARGRVVKRRSQADRRQVVVSLTPEADAIAARVLSQRRAVLEDVLGRLSPSDRAAFVRGLLLLAQAAESWTERRPSVEASVSH